MSAISQKYNTYLQGMSDQPDEIMKPGQLKDSLNTFPDVTFGLLKRPALGFTRLLDTPDLTGVGVAIIELPILAKRRIHHPGIEEWTHQDL